MILSIRQPWAWAICAGFKDIENRSWNTNFRGRFLVHAGLSLDLEGLEWIKELPPRFLEGAHIPHQNEFQRGGIVGEAELYNVVKGEPLTPSIWYQGPYGFWLRNAKPLPFRPMKGKLGFFNEAATPSPDGMHPQEDK